MNTTMINMAHCLKSQDSFGSTTWFNVCDKTSQLVPWGALDWAHFIVGASFMSIFLAGMAAIAVTAAKEVYDYYR